MSPVMMAIVRSSPRQPSTSGERSVSGPTSLLRDVAALTFSSFMSFALSTAAAIFSFRVLIASSYGRSDVGADVDRQQDGRQQQQDGDGQDGRHPVVELARGLGEAVVEVSGWIGGP